MYVCGSVHASVKRCEIMNRDTKDGRIGGTPLKTGERIERARKAAKLTQHQLAERIGKTKSAIANYESGYRDPDKQTLAAIADALDVTVQSLEDRHLDSVQDVMEVLFQMEEQGFGIEPVRIGSSLGARSPAAPHAGLGLGDGGRAARAHEGWHPPRIRVRHLARIFWH